MSNPVATDAEFFDVTLTPEPEWDGAGWGPGHAKCDTCGERKDGIEYWSRGSWILFLCYEHAFSEWEVACARVFKNIESNWKAAQLEIIEMSDRAQEEYR